MPKTIDRDLLDCLRRPNPNVEYRAEISAPDVGLVLRRPDQFIGPDDLMVVGPTPANSLTASIRGLELAGTSANLANFTGTASSFDLNREDPQRRLKGMRWTVDPAFNRGVLRSFTARVTRATGVYTPPATDFELQIYRVVRVPGVIVAPNGSVTPRINFTFQPLLSTAAIVRAANITWAGADATILFPLENYGVVIDNGPPDSVSPDQTSELPAYYFVMKPVNPPALNGSFTWKIDTATSRTIASVGTFERVFWNRDSDQNQWAQQVFADVPSCTVAIDSYAASGQAVYLIDLGRVPSAGTTGRIVFERRLPRGTTATLELSTAGSGGAWTVMTHGQLVTVVQQVYHLRVTIAPDSSSRASPAVTAMGIDFRTPIDVSLESIMEFPTREIEPPWGRASIPEARVSVIRSGVRNYLDQATMLGSTKPASQLEAEMFLASRHPAVTRDKWLLLERLGVSNRHPSPTSEMFSLLAYSSKLKRKIPEKSESLSSQHTVTTSTTSQVTVTPNLLEVTASGNEYDGKGYYMRVRTSASTGIPLNFQQQIQGNTGVDKLDFTPALPQALTAGDVIEVHSGTFKTVPLVWEDEDPSVVWKEILNLGGIPPERVGHGSLPRGGYPPSIADRAPGDTTTQNKLRVTNKIADAKSLDELLYQVSALMGGATLEIDSQICFIQLYPLRGADGTVTVPLPPVAAMFDVRDIASGSLSTPPGLERRSTVVSGGYGKNLAAADPDSFPSKATVVVDNDALAWLTKQDLEEVGSSEVPEEIAAWCYNTYDEGLFLATDIASQPVRAASTGLRLFPFGLVDAHPELLPGDPIVLITDQYTDYDPSRQVALRGPLAIKGVLTSVGNAGRSFRMFVQGLADGVVQISGGRADPYPFFLGQARPDALFGLLDFRVISETSTERTYGWTRGAFVASVWAGVVDFAAPLPADPWGQVAEAIVQLPATQNTLTVRRPTGSNVTLIQVEPREADLTPGTIRRATLEAAPPQAPIIETVAAESDTTGSLYARVQERGQAVVSVQVQIQIGKEDAYAWVAPNRGEGDFSYVKQRTMVAGEYEHDVRLADTRISRVQYRVILSSGEILTTEPVYFDRNTTPDILFADGDGPFVTVIGDSDTQSILLEHVGGSWSLWTDGKSIKVNVQITPGNNASGSQIPMGSGQRWAIKVTAYSKPRLSVTSATPLDTANVIVVGTVAEAPPVWEFANLVGPAANGSKLVTLLLDASASAGYTTRVWARYNPGSGFTVPVDITSALTPVPVAPPAAQTTYTWNGLSAAYNRTDSSGPNGSGAIAIEVELTSEILNNIGVVVASATRSAIWYWGGTTPTGSPSGSPPTGGPVPDPSLPPFVPTAVWENVSVAGPGLGSKDVQITLDADIASGSTRLWMRYDDGNGWTSPLDITASVSPALSTPPAASTVYTYSGLPDVLIRSTHLPTVPVVVEIEAQIIQDGLVVSTLTRQAAWQYHDPAF